MGDRLGTLRIVGKRYFFMRENGVRGEIDTNRGTSATFFTQKYCRRPRERFRANPSENLVEKLPYTVTYEHFELFGAFDSITYEHFELFLCTDSKQF